MADICWKFGEGNSRVAGYTCGWLLNAPLQRGEYYPNVKRQSQQSATTLKLERQLSKIREVFLCLIEYT